MCRLVRDLQGFEFKGMDSPGFGLTPCCVCSVQAGRKTGNRSSNVEDLRSGTSQMLSCYLTRHNFQQNGVFSG